MLVRKPTTPRPQVRSSAIRSVPRGSYAGSNTISMADISDDRTAQRRSSIRRSSAVSVQDDGKSGGLGKSGGSKRKSLQNAPRRISICAQIEKDVDNHKQDKLSSGWQMRYDKVCDRVSALFNCWTMSDVVFHLGNRQIPGHKFILGMASPVIFTQCCQSNPLQLGNLAGQPSMCASGTCTPKSESSRRTGSVAPRRTKSEQVSTNHVRIVIDDYPFDAFFEFIRFIYTDDVMITVSNVKSLIFLADEYKLYRLSDLCFEFLRSGIHGESVLRVLESLRTLLMKACVSLWKEVIDRSRALEQFRELNMVERRAQMQALSAASKSGSFTRGGSRIHSARHSVASSDSGMSSRTGISSRYGDGEDEYGDTLDGDQLNDQLLGRSSKDSRQKSHQLYLRIVNISEELNSKCWRCVSEATEVVLACNAWAMQPLNIVKEILRLEVVNVPEIALFRALIEWANKRCRDQGLAPLPENCLKVIGDETLQLVRFPRMTLEQILWEVVPTGVLDFKDLENLQNTISNRNSTVGRFNGEPRQAPICDKLKHAKRSAAKKDHTRQRASFTVPLPNQLPKQERTEQWAPSIAESGNEAVVNTNKSPVYHTAANDEIDALLATQLLRFHVDRFVDDHANDLAAAEAGISAGSGETSRAVLLADPVTIGQDVEGEGQQASRQLMPMLMHTQNWLAQELMEERQTDMQEAELTTLVSRSQNEANYTGWGETPGPQDFKRVAKGLYSFRGNRILEMTIENGEAVVYEKEDEDRDEDEFDLRAEDLEGMSEEAIRREYGLESEAKRTKVTLTAFLCRQ